VDCQLVSDSQSDKSSDEGGEGNTPTPLYHYEDVFWQRFPYYLSIGMTEAQYWDGDCTLTKYFREAEKLREERANRQAWLQGMYVYDAISRISPILHAFAKKGTKPQPYVSEPYPLTEEKVEERKRKEEKEKAQKGLRYMQGLMVATNKRFEKGSE
jgi:hypothetical protein